MPNMSQFPCWGAIQHIGICPKVNFDNSAASVDPQCTSIPNFGKTVQCTARGDVIMSTWADVT